jgi:hypothetical protein
MGILWYSHFYTANDSLLYLLIFCCYKRKLPESEMEHYLPKELVDSHNFIGIDIEHSQKGLYIIKSFRAHFDGVFLQDHNDSA